MLSLIMHEFEKEDTPLTLDGLSRRLKVEKRALEGMLDVLVRKGKLRLDSDSNFDSDSCNGMACAGCRAGGACPFASPMPRTYVLIKNGESPQGLVVEGN